MKIYIGKSFLLLIAGFIFGICVFWMLNSVFFSPLKASQDILVKESSKYSHIRPLILPWDKDSDKARELIPFRESINKHIERYIESKKATLIAYYFRDLNNGPWFGINVSIEFKLASLLKVPVMMSYYRLAEQDKTALEKKITFDGVSTNTIDYNALTKPAGSLVSGKSYTVEELIQKMIIDSDNDAFKMLVDNIDVGLLADPYNLTEIEILSKNQDYISTIREYSTFMRVLYNASYLSRPYSEKALQVLIQSKFKNGLVAGVPEHVEVAHKFGIRQTDDTYQLHDCGIVYYAHFPYQICVMTQGKNLEELADVVKGLSQETYTQVSKQLSGK